MISVSTLYDLAETALAWPGLHAAPLSKLVIFRHSIIKSFFITFRERLGFCRAFISILGVHKYACFVFKCYL